jgi:fructuronate reductase
MLKLRLLNGTHSLIAYLGMLAGQRYIAGAVRIPAIEKAARALITDEYLPTLTVPDGINLPLYIEQLLQRFGNTAIAHPTTQVGTDGSLKLPMRITDAAHHHLDRGVVPHVIALMVAAYIACLATPHSYDTRAVGTVRDPAAPRLAELGARYPEPRQLTRAVFAEAGIFTTELAERQPFLDVVADLLATLRRHGVAAAVDQALVN